jgi:hypothetical protein
MMRIVIAYSLFACLLTACSDAAGPTTPAETPETPAAKTQASGVELRVSVPMAGRVFAKLAPPGVVAIDGDPKGSSDWDLAFEGFDLFTNGGASGAGHAAAFGPLDAAAFDVGEAPEVPFTTADKAGGAFDDWYAYDDAAHALWSRYHVFGVKDGTRAWKVQVLSYYGERNGAPASALYAIRYAELTANGALATQEARGIDGTAGGAQSNPTAASECIDLGTGARAMLTEAASAASTEWHLCFRRSAVRVNGGVAGPRGVVAVDLEAGAAETTDQIEARTPESERPRFDAVTLASFADKTFRGDRVVSAFGGAWLDPTRSRPAPGTWLVVDASGQQKHLVTFQAFEGSTATTPGTIVLRVKPAKG